MNKLSRRTFKRSTMVFWLCAAFLAGAGIAHGGPTISGVFIWLSGLVALVALRRKTLWTVLWVVLFGMCLGLWRGGAYAHKLGDYRQLYGQKVTLTAQATQDANYGFGQQLSFTADTVAVEATGQRLAGKIELSGFGTNAVFQGDTIVATGKLRPAYGAYQAEMSYAQLRITGHHDTLVANLRRHFAAGMQSALPEPLASFGMGLLIGQRATLPDQVKRDLLMVGLTHIIAVSGYNLTIILRASKGILGKRSKRQATLLSLALIGIFLLFTGSSASIVRAAIVSLLSIAAGYYGRQIKPLVLIMLAAAITGYANPFYVWTDTSWYLSFLAFYGVLVLAPLIQERLHRRWQDTVVFSVALESLCAEIMTLPFVLFTFGQMSFIGLVANVLVVALIPYAMLLAFVAGLAGMLVPAVAGWFAWPARILLTYMLDIAHILSRIPHVFVEHLGLPVSSMLFLYLLLVAITSVLWFKNKSRSATITDEIQSRTEGV